MTLVPTVKIGVEATETEDQKQRNELMDQILAYNREDLEATWAVLKWLRSKRDSATVHTI